MRKSRKLVLGLVAVAVVCAVTLVFADSATAGYGCRGYTVGYYPGTVRYYGAYRPYYYGYYPSPVYRYRTYRPYYYGSWYGYGGYGYGSCYSSCYAPHFSYYGCY